MLGTDSNPLLKFIRPIAHFPSHSHSPFTSVCLDGSNNCYASVNTYMQLLKISPILGFTKKQTQIRNAVEAKAGL